MLRVMVPSLAALGFFLLMVGLIEEWTTRGGGRDPDYNLTLSVLKWWSRVEVARLIFHFAVYTQRVPDFNAMDAGQLNLVLWSYFVVFTPAMIPAFALWTILERANSEPSLAEIETKKRLRERREQYQEGRGRGGGR